MRQQVGPVRHRPCAQVGELVLGRDKAQLGLQTNPRQEVNPGAKTEDAVENLRVRAIGVVERTQLEILSENVHPAEDADLTLHASCWGGSRGAVLGEDGSLKR